MSKPVNNMDYYDLVNLNHFVNKSLLKDNSISFTYLKNFVDEKTSQFKYKGLEEILPDDILEILLKFNVILSNFNILFLIINWSVTISFSFDDSNSVNSLFIMRRSKL